MASAEFYQSEANELEEPTLPRRKHITELLDLPKAPKATKAPKAPKAYKAPKFGGLRRAGSHGQNLKDRALWPAPFGLREN